MANSKFNSDVFKFLNASQVRALRTVVPPADLAAFDWVPDIYYLMIATCSRYSDMFSLQKEAKKTHVQYGPYLEKQVRGNTVYLPLWIFPDTDMLLDKYANPDPEGPLLRLDRVYQPSIPVFFNLLRKIMAPMPGISINKSSMEARNTFVHLLAKQNVPAWDICQMTGLPYKVNGIPPYRKKKSLEALLAATSGLYLKELEV